MNVILIRNAAFIQANPPVVPDYAHAMDVPLWSDHRHNLFQILDNRRPRSAPEEV